MTIGEWPPGSGAAERAALVGALAEIPGIIGVEIDEESGPEGAPGTLRLQLAPGADDVAVAAAVNDVLRRRFALAVDADRVEVVEETVARPAGPAQRRDRVASLPVTEPVAPAPAPVPDAVPEAVPEQLETPEPPRPPAPPRPPEPPRPPAPPRPPRPPRPEAGTSDGSPPGRRFVLERATFSAAGLGTSVSVTLSYGGAVHVGTVEAAATAAAASRAVAQATMRAVELGLGSRQGQLRAEVDRVEMIGSGADRVAVVVVSLLTVRGPERHAGAALVAGDSRQAVIRATLAAVNRRLERFLD